MSGPLLAARAPDDPTYHVDPGRGWILFAGIALGLAGVLNVANGIAAVSESHFYVSNAEYVIGNLSSLGWLLLVIGVVQVIVAFGIWAANEWARWLGIGSAMANMLIQFLAFAARPGLGLALFMVDVIVIYGLLTYGGDDRRYLGD
jgi:uncharacterized membrane protein (DUF2068 family)